MNLAFPSSGEVLVSQKSEGVVEVRLNRPDKLNALTDDMYAALTDLFGRFHEDTAVRAVILTGEGRGFCSGSDIGGMLKVGGSASRARLQRRHAAVRAIYDCEKPVVAAVRGPVTGIGFSVAMACDFIVASDTAYFQQAFRNIALVPDGGSIFFLGQRLGIGRAKDLVMSARKLSAAEALDWGLASRLAADGDLETTALELAEDLARAPTYMLGLSKKMFAAACSPSLETVLEIESYAASVARSSADHREGVAAFREKRQPNFTGE
ncbi:enoyl-CoA hydratase/isomerase family protein [Shinella sp.]|uniref:enoyl-CoA hydratase/isomerase family protein n=1 Tax=Shinella sp. TaxID=1870904 RepID=UPI003F70F308